MSHPDMIFHYHARSLVFSRLSLFFPTSGKFIIYRQRFKAVINNAFYYFVRNIPTGIKYRILFITAFPNNGNFNTYFRQSK